MGPKAFHECFLSCLKHFCNHLQTKNPSCFKTQNLTLYCKEVSLTNTSSCMRKATTGAKLMLVLSFCEHIQYLKLERWHSCSELTASREQRLKVKQKEEGGRKQMQLLVHKELDNFQKSAQQFSTPRKAK